jgi:hypothetical protein
VVVTATKTAEQIAKELRDRSWTFHEPVEQRNLMRRVASLLRFGPLKLS